jgi:hypothetical protein
MKQPKETITLGQLKLSFLLDGDDTDNQLVMFEFTIPAGATKPFMGLKAWYRPS